MGSSMSPNFGRVNLWSQRLNSILQLLLYIKLPDRACHFNTNIYGKTFICKKSILKSTNSELGIYLYYTDYAVYGKSFKYPKYTEVDYKAIHFHQYRKVNLLSFSYFILAIRGLCRHLNYFHFFFFFVLRKFCFSIYCRRAYGTM